MVKLGEQVRALSQVTRPTRTERLLAEKERQRQLAEQRAEIQNAQAKLSKASTIEQYENIYTSLSAFQQSAFKSPAQLKQEKQIRIQQTIPLLEAEIEKAREKITQLRQERRFTGSMEEEHDVEEKIIEQEGLIKGYNKAVSQLKEGKDISKSEADKYARDLGSALRDEQEARNEKKEVNRRARIEAEEQFAKKTAEAQAKGFTFTGTVRGFKEGEFFEEKRFEKGKFIGGVEVKPSKVKPEVRELSFIPFSSKRFMKTFGLPDVAIIKQQEQKLESTKARIEAEEKLKRSISAGEEARGEIEPLPIVPVKEPKTYQKVLGFGSDILASIIPSGTIRGKKPTTISEEEINLYRSAFYSPDVLERKVIPSPFVLSQIQALTFGARRRFREGEPEAIALNEEAKQLQPKLKTDIETIESAQKELTDITKKRETIATKLESPDIKPDERQKLEKEFADLETKQNQVIQKTAQKGVNIGYDVDAQGNTSLSFSTPSISRARELSKYDISSPEIKQLRNLDEKTRYIQEAGIVGAEFITYTGIGYGLGASGVLSVAGKGFQAVTPVLRASPLFPLTTKAGVYTLGAGVVAFKGYKEAQLFKEAGLPATEGFIFGATRTSAQFGGLALGGVVGSEVRVSGIINKTKTGGFTRTAKIKETMSERQIQKIRSELVKGGATSKDLARFNKFLNQPLPSTRVGVKVFSLKGKPYLAIEQRDVLVTRFGESDIKAFTQVRPLPDTTGEVAIGERSRGVAGITTKVTGTKGLEQTRFKGLATYIREGGKTGVVLTTETKKGVIVQQFQTEANINKIIQLAEKGATKTLFVDVKSLTRQTAYPEVLKGVRLKQIVPPEIPESFISKKSIIYGEPYSYGRIQQIIKTNERGFSTIGSARIGRTEAVMNLLKQKLSTGTLVFRTPVETSIVEKKLFVSPTPLLNIRSPVALIPNTPAVFTIPQQATLTNLPTGIDIVAESIKPALLLDIKTKALIGSGLLYGATTKFDLRDRVKLGLKENLTQRIKNLQVTRPTEIQITPTSQVTGQKEALVQRQLTEQIIEEPITTPIISPIIDLTPPILPPAIPKFDLGLAGMELKRKVRGKKKKGRQLAYLPDFTAKVLNLKPLEVSLPEAQKLTTKIQTGFEIRRGARIK